MRRDLVWLLSLVLLLSTVLAACSGGGSQGTTSEAGSTSSAGSTETEGAAGGELIVAVASDAKSLDPHGSNDSPSSQMIANMYESLLTLDQQMQVKPALATSYERVDETTWEFYLREGVKFHDGADFNAEAVKMTFERVLDPELNSPRAFLFDMISEINVIDEHTVQIVTEYPFSPLPNHLAHTAGGIISPLAIEEENNGGKKVTDNPMGTGPFEFVSWETGNSLTFKRNEHYWQEPTKIEKLTALVVPEASTRLAMLETGEVHIIEKMRINDVSRVENATDMDLLRVESVTLNYIGFNTSKKPLDDPRVRKALSMAINKDEIVDGVLDGIGTKANGAISGNVFGYSSEIQPIEFNVEAAKALLAEAGYPDGFSLSIMTNDDNPVRTEIAELVQAQLKQIGVEVDINLMEFGAFLDKTENAEHDMFILGWVTVTADADYIMYPLFHSQNHGASGNRSFYTNAKVDELLVQARQESQEKRLDMYKELQQLLVDEAPIIPVYFEDYLLGIRSNVKGFWHRPDNMMQFHEVTIQ